jgi:hypothetical protein
MSREQYLDIKFSAERLVWIERINEVVKERSESGFVLTLRALHYQMVSRFPPKDPGNPECKESVSGGPAYFNTFRSYKNLGTLVSDGRMAGLIDWDAVEDRGRVAQRPYFSNSIEDTLRGAIEYFKLDRWDKQPHYAEFWVEKDAVSSYMEPLKEEFDATLVVNKGYSSTTAMHNASRRFLRQAGKGKKIHLFYLGDFDPSGEDMVRDIDDRLKIFGVEDLDVQKLALNMDQIRRYKLPPSPLKGDDSRSAAFEAEHGRRTWELDALEPQVMQDLVRAAFKKILNRKIQEVVLGRERDLKSKARHAISDLDDSDSEEEIDDGEE